MWVLPGASLLEDVGGWISVGGGSAADDVDYRNELDCNLTRQVELIFCILW